MNDLLGVVHQAGQHAAIFGERGVGKTSLAKVMEAILASEMVAVRVGCDGADSFETVWRKALSQVKVALVRPSFGFTKDEWSVALESASRYLPANEPISPESVRLALRTISQTAPVVIFLDEFDQLPGNGHLDVFADLIKTLSDDLTNATVVFVGVADNVTELISAHQSIERSLVQIHMPRMVKAELSEIVTRGLREASMAIDDDALDEIASLSHGFPHYTHLLGQLAAMTAAGENREFVSMSDVREAVGSAIERAQQSIRDAYLGATTSPRATLFPQVVLACALTKGDDFGFFAAADLREPMSGIMGRRIEIPTFQKHLRDLSDPKRGSLLQKRGRPRRLRYRFTNPLMQPYVILRGIAEGTIDRSAIPD
jgi:Cdc6-like AAA superfamily ATPase